MKFNITFITIILSIFLLGCKQQESEIQHLANVEYAYTKMDKKIQAIDSTLDKIIAPYRKEMGSEMQQEIGIIEEDLVKRKPNSNMGNWFADILEDEAKVVFPDIKIDFAFQNYGGLRVPVMAKGPITKGDIFELMPFDNTLIASKIGQKEMQQLMDRIANYGGWPISRSLSFEIKDSLAVNIKLNGKSISEQDSFMVALPDYVANGGDDCEFLKGKIFRNSGRFIRDIVIEHIERDAKIDQIQFVDHTERITTNQ